MGDSLGLLRLFFRIRLKNIDLKRSFGLPPESSFDPYKTIVLFSP